MVINDNVQNCVYTSTYPTITYWYNYSVVDQIKVEAMKLALDTKSGRSFKEIAKLASQIEEWLRG